MPGQLSIKARLRRRRPLGGTGSVDEGLLTALLDEPYLRLPPPKSTGRELFNMDWLEAKLGSAHGGPGRASHAAAADGRQPRDAVKQCAPGAAIYACAAAHTIMGCSRRSPDSPFPAGWRAPPNSASIRTSSRPSLSRVRETHAGTAALERRERDRREGPAHSRRHIRVSTSMNDLELQTPQLIYQS